MTTENHAKAPRKKARWRSLTSTEKTSPDFLVERPDVIEDQARFIEGIKPSDSGTGHPAKK
ncbi:MULTISPECIES: hypothetical protein [Enterobacteriaceae]|uniref:hypothetical protein n=1 Tax=Enterobacteriaceae TaxID=543 RepID=UPI0017832642|nr:MULTISPECIES: hypothetical protein [Enterobacteriaceae]MBD9984612.1 hypothetical protein [Citrobacter portucalensis]MBD9998442.1 hypothetical protein [Escherichia coli]MBE0034553.1 hypothetical protein [Citrobacter portucalensis]MBE0037286.1 hypothetical protein [Citrobacter portucalensis]MBE0044997.1 hypothetical protein [Citrobacter portucalensis]